MLIQTKTKTMKKIITLAGVAIFALSAGSCKKCSTCSVKDVFDVDVYTAPESCGKKKKVEDYQANVAAEWANYTDEDGNALYTVTCTDIE